MVGVKKMSSRTETRKKAAKASGGLGRMLSLLGVVFTLGFFGLFIWQAGVISPPSPQDVRSTDTVQKPDQTTSQNAGIAGLDSNNRPYEIRAKTGEQDKDTKSIIYMDGVASVFERSTGAKMDVTSDKGVYNRDSKALELTGNVVFVEGNRMKALMEKAHINTKDQTLVSQSPVKVDMQGTLIEAETLTVTQGGARILFKGGVKAKLKTNKTGDTPQ
jgi:lipopolysaccharide export system protein LptC